MWARQLSIKLSINLIFRESTLNWRETVGQEKLVNVIRMLAMRPLAVSYKKINHTLASKNTDVSLSTIWRHLTKGFDLLFCKPSRNTQFTTDKKKKRLIFAPKQHKTCYYNSGVCRFFPMSQVSSIFLLALIHCPLGRKEYIC